MNPVLCFTLNELQKLVPNFRKEALDLKDEVIQEKIRKMFWNLGADSTKKIEIQDGVLSRNRFGEEDNSTRFILHERLDKEYVLGKYASDYAKTYVDNKDYEMVIDLGKIKNRRAMEY